MTDEDSTELLHRLKKLFSRDHLLGPGEGIDLKRVRLIGVDSEWFYLMRYKSKKSKSVDLCELDSFAGMATWDLWEHACRLEHRDELELYIDKEWDGCPRLSVDDRFRQLVVRMSTHATMIYTYRIKVADKFQDMQRQYIDYIEIIEAAYRNALIPVGWDGNRKTGVLMCKKMSLDIFQ